MAFQLSPWREREKLQIAKSLQHLQSDKDEGNPSVLPLAILQRFQWTFLIRHPQQSIPSLFRLSSTAAKREETGWQYFLPSESGYYELRRMYDHLSRQGVIPSLSPQSVDGEKQQGAHPCLIDAEDLLRQPEKVVKAYCGCIGLDYRPDMLQWDSNEDVDQAAQVFATWTAFHRDAIESRGLEARKPRPSRSKEEVFDSWVTEFGEEGATLIQKTIKENLPHYLYLKQFAIQIEDC
ncbi:putative Sulfotransferase domain-containing protein [Seiridium cardinale]